jgi:hypothetical protein
MMDEDTYCGTRVLLPVQQIWALQPREKKNLILDYIVVVNKIVVSNEVKWGEV